MYVYSTSKNVPLYFYKHIHLIHGVVRNAMYFLWDFETPAQHCYIEYEI